VRRQRGPGALHTMGHRAGTLGLRIEDPICQAAVAAYGNWFCTKLQVKRPQNILEPLDADAVRQHCPACVSSINAASIRRRDTVIYKRRSP